MNRCKILLLIILVALTGSLPAAPQAASQDVTFDRYHNPDEVNQILKDLAARYPQLASLQTIGKSAGGTDLCVLQIAALSGPEPATRPAVFVSANIEGTHLIGTEAALQLAGRLLAGSASDAKLKGLLEKRTILIAPLLNPDAARAYFTTPRWERTSNGNPLDDDLDMQIDEDGPDDLNQDGQITSMRVKDPEGEWIIDPGDPRLMRKADPQKGESGVYKVYVEGLDNDRDRSYNEDPPGGVDIQRNFPHDFETNEAEAGRWPISQKETLALAQFLAAHRNIALVLNYSHENTLLNLEQTGRARASGERVKVPQRFANMLGVDPDQEFDIKEVVEMIKSSGALPAGMEITEDRVAQMLGLGPAVAIDRQDLQVFETVQKEYKDALKSAQLDYPEKKARGVGKGSFLAYCYYQYGVPVFSTDVWTVPEVKKEAAKNDELTLEKIKGMTKEQFLAIDETRLDAFLKAQGGGSGRFGAAEIRKMVESGQVTPARMAEMAERMQRARPGGGAGVAGAENVDTDVLKWSDTVLEGKGFVAWSPFKHPTLGDVEIGGFAPFVRVLPPPAQIEKLASFTTDFYLKLIDRLADLTIRETRVEAVDENLFNVTCYLTNPGWLPTSTAQGRRAQTSWPIRVRIKTAEDQAVFSGRPTETIPSLAGSGGTQKLEWTVRGKRGSTVEISAESPKLGSVSTRVTLE
ncbi:MAG: hypothetical protein EHM23_26220 [Acidobacteria bacterium]|nr:MAG: hypothetical protein EHM23_26220 [Acidobacteriota bacterium]